MVPVAAKTLWDALKLKLKIKGETDYAAMQDMTNLTYMDFCAKWPWRALRRTCQITYTSADTAGAWFPSDAVNIYHAQDADGNVFYERDIANIQEDDPVHRWYCMSVNDSPTIATGFSLTPNSATVGGSSFTSAQVGEYVTFAGHMGVYRIASTTTLTAPWRGRESFSDVTAMIRPEGTMRIQVIDDAADLYAGTVAFYYWVYPLPLLRDYDAIMLPGTEALEMAVCKRYQGDYKGDKVGAQMWMQQYDRAFREMKAADPIAVTQSAPKGADGMRVYFGRRRST